MKTTLLKSLPLLLGGAILTLPLVVQAGVDSKDNKEITVRDPEKSCLSPWSVSVFGGWTFGGDGDPQFTNQDGINADFNPALVGAGVETLTHGSLHQKNGFLVGGDFGYRFELEKKWSIQAGFEGIYQNAPADFSNSASLFLPPAAGGPSTASETSTLKIQDITYYLPKAAIRYDIGNFTPYVGAGIGAADVHYKLTTSYNDPDGFLNPTLAPYSSTNSQTRDTWTLATDFFAGTEYKFATHWSVYGEYKFLYIPEISTHNSTLDGTNANPSGDLTRKVNDYYTHNVILGIKYQF